MRKTITLSFFFFMFCFRPALAQSNYGVKGFYPQTFTLSDSIPAAEYYGLKAGYEIRETDTESKKSNQNYLAADNGWLSDNPNNPAAIWSIQESSTPNAFYIKNAGTNARLYVESGQLKISNSFISNDALSKWIIEK